MLKRPWDSGQYQFSWELYISVLLANRKGLKRGLLPRGPVKKGFTNYLTGSFAGNEEQNRKGQEKLLASGRSPGTHRFVPSTGKVYKGPVAAKS